jgi:hypothetical protein
MSYGLSNNAEQKPLFGGASSSSSSTATFERGGPSSATAFPGQQALDNVQQLQSPASNSKCCCNFCSVNTTRRLLHSLGALNGVIIIMVGVVTGIGWVHNCPSPGCAAAGTGFADTSCCYCVWTDVILPCYTTFLGGILAIAELRLPCCHRRCKDGCGFMFSLTWRCFYLLFIGSFGFAIKCSAYTWVGWGAGVFTVLNVVLSCWIMNAHPGFLTLTGHEEFSETTDRALGIQQASKYSDGARGNALTQPVANNTSGGGGGGGGGSGYAPPHESNNNHGFNAPDPYATSGATAAAAPVNPMFPEAQFDANPFA